MRAIQPFFLILTATAVLCAGARLSGEGWTSHYPPVPAGHLQAVAAGDGAFVAVGQGGDILFSADAVEWSVAHEGDGRSLHSVATSGSLWVAVGDEWILSSPDGLVWTSFHEVSGTKLYWIVWSGDRWVAVGRSGEGNQHRGVILESLDGSSWETAAEFPGIVLHSVAFAPDGRGLATGWDLAAGAGAGLRFDPGGEWLVNPDAPTLDLRAIRWDGEQFAAAGELGMVAFTTTGHEWETYSTGASQSFPDAVITDGIYEDIVRGPGFYVAVGTNTWAGLNRDLRAFSIDGKTWSTQTLHEIYPRTFGLAATGDAVLAVGEWNSVHRVGASGTWSVLAGEIAQVHGIAFGNGIYVAVAGLTLSPSARSYVPIVAPKVLVSENLTDWTVTEQEGARKIRDVAFADGWFVGVGEQGLIARSIDGVTWQPVESPVIGGLLRVIHADGHFVAAGEKAVVVSPDGLNWTNVSPGFEWDGATFIDIAWGEGRFVVAGRDGWEGQQPTLFISRDLESWERAWLPGADHQWSSRTLLGVAHGPQGFFATGYRSLGVLDMRSVAVYSTNGIDWHFRETAEGGPMSGIAWFEGRFIASGYVPSTPDNIGAPYWEFYDANSIERVDDSGAPPYAWRLRKVNGRLFGLGDGGTIASLGPTGAPHFLHQPVDAVVEPGKAATFSLQAENPHESEMSVQWLFDGEPLEDNDLITGSDSAQLSIASVTHEDAGPYSVRLSNAAGETLSRVVQLHVRRPIEVSVNFDATTPGWGVDRFASIQTAIDSVSPDEFAMVIVLPGVYTENITFNGRPLLLTSEDSNDWATVEATIIDGGGSASVVRIVDGEGELAILRGLTIRNGRAKQGGGVYIENSHPRITGNRIINNLAEADAESDGGGGGVSFYLAWNQTGAFRLTDNVIDENTATRADKWGGFGGGVNVRALGRIDLFIEGNTIAENDSSYGGGARVVVPGRSTIAIRDNTIRDNTSPGGGGGIDVSGGSGTEVLIENNRVLFNSGQTGGGLNVMDSLSSYGRLFKRLELRNNRIIGNKALIGGGARLSAFEYGAIDGNIFAANEAELRGGAMAISATSPIHLLLDHCTIVANQAPSESAISTFQVNATLRNSIVALNDGGPLFGLGLDSHYNNIWANFADGSNLADIRAGQSGNVSFDPVFADVEGGDFRLRSQAGRWDPAADGGNGGWVIDVEHSPSIAAGAPDEDGLRRNQGAYGLTAEASRPLGLPLVSVASRMPGYLDKATGQEGAIVLSRSGPLEAGLPMTVTLGGTAEEGVDFEMTGDAGFFGPGEAVKLVTFAPAPAESVRGDRTISFTLETATHYDRGLSRAGEIPVYDLPYHSWIARHFSTEDWENPTLTAPTADPAGGGLPNLTRFAFAMEEGSDQRNLPRAGISLYPEYLTVEFVRPTRHHGVDYAVEASGNLSNWEPVEAVEVFVEPLENDAERVTLRDTMPIRENDGVRFLRVRVNLAP